MIYAYSCPKLTRGNVLVVGVPAPTNHLATEVLDNLNRYPHCILLTRVGQFYEVNCDLSRSQRLA